MKAVARLVYSYFMGGAVLRYFTIAGLVLLSVDFYILIALPYSGEKLWLAIFGVILLFLGSSSMPVMFGRLARSHSIGVLPGGRFKLLASAFVTVVLVAIPVGVLSPAAFMSGVSSSSLRLLMEDPMVRDYLLTVAAISFSSAMLFASWIYLAMWFMTSQRNVAGLMKGMLVIVLVIFAPARDLDDLTMSLSWNLLQLAIIGVVFGTGFLLWPRFKAMRARRNRARFSGIDLVFSRGTTGREFDLMLGTSNPWQLVVALILPLVIATRFLREAPSVWLFFLTICSVVTGAYSGQAAGRSRALWLRGQWSRAALFAAVERSVWRHSGIVLGVLMLLTVGIGLYARFTPVLLMASLLLLALGTVLSTYLGLMITRGLRGLEIVSGAAVMLLLMTLALLIGQEIMDLVSVFAMEIGLAVLAVVFRLVARHRWTQIDWMMCRPDRALNIRGT